MRRNSVRYDLLESSHFYRARSEGGIFYFTIGEEGERIFDFGSEILEFPKSDEPTVLYGTPISPEEVGKEIKRRRKHLDKLESLLKSHQDSKSVASTSE